MKENNQRKAAKAFAEKWKGIGDEKQHTHSFWIELFQKVYGIEDATDKFEFEYRVKREAVSGKRDTTVTFIDALVPSTHVLIEQKSITVDLDTAYEQSDKQGLTPYAQAMQYNAWLPADLRAKWIIVCNFDEFRIHDLNDPMGKPTIVHLADLADNFHALDFMIDSTVEKVSVEEKISVRAGEIVGALYDRFLDRYSEEERNTPEVLKDINKLCVRIVFCLYAEDAGIFKYGQFRDYLNESRVESMHEDLQKLFVILNTPYENRPRFLSQSLKDFPYVNGGLFASEVEIPPFDETMRTFLLTDASEGFNWRDISPTIFGAVFESTLNPETRHQGGMHYTSIENIGKVINPLFLDGLKAELETIRRAGAKRSQLLDYQNKLARLQFLDPACGSGNFLTETFIQLRTLENQVIEELYGGQRSFDVEGLTSIKVNISQFHGIEINDFAISVAQTALWIAEHQMMQKVEAFVHEDFLPLHTKANLIEGNALQIDWESVVPKEKLTYIMGNPPFLGQSARLEKQSADMATVFGKGNVETKLDYVICWFKKALNYITASDHQIKVAFVATNSICQGESVPVFWKNMINAGTELLFAYRSFEWTSEATAEAHVHCVIVGFQKRTEDKKKKKIFCSDGTVVTTDHINAYLLDAPDIWITNRINKPMAAIPEMTTGSPPTDDGGLLLTAEEYQEWKDAKNPLLEVVRPFIGAREFLRDLPGHFSRYCLWFAGHDITKYAKNKELIRRMEIVRKQRLKSNADRIKKAADYPYLFCQNRQPTGNYLAIPRHSSERRQYIPIGFIEPDVIAGDACSIVPNASLYQFGIMMSKIHNYWLKAICGRLEMRYRYSPSVYNNFPWLDVDEKARTKIEATAQAILDARANHPNASLADLYQVMPLDLRKAHDANDKAVMSLYGFKASMSEDSILAELMKLYHRNLAEYEKNETVDAAVQKVLGKKAETVPDWMQGLRQQCLDGTITPDELITQGKARLKEEKKKAKEAEKAASKAKN